MPIYGYTCAVCGHKQDHLQKSADASLTLCPKCFHHAYQKDLSAPGGFDLRGGGYYQTDFKGKP